MAVRVWLNPLFALSAGLVLLACLAGHESNAELARDSFQHGTFTDSRDGTVYEWLEVEIAAQVVSSRSCNTEPSRA